MEIKQIDDELSYRYGCRQDGLYELWFGRREAYKPVQFILLSTPTHKANSDSDLRWMSAEELDAEMDWKPATELTEAVKRITEEMVEQSCSGQANQERFCNAQAEAEFLQQPVIYSQRRQRYKFIEQNER